MWFRRKPPPRDLTDLVRDNLMRPNEAPAVRYAPPETRPGPIGPTKPLESVDQSMN